MAPNTQIGKLIIEDPDNPDRIYSLAEHHDMFVNDDDTETGRARYSRGGEFLENHMSGNVLEFCRRWMRLGNIFEVIDDIKEFFKFNKYHGKPMEWSLKDTIYFTNTNTIDAITFREDYMMEPAVMFSDPLPNQTKVDLQEKIKEGALL